MGVVLNGRWGIRSLVWLTALLLGGGCAVTPPPSTGRLLRNRALIDFTGLRSVETIGGVKVSAACPIGWERIDPRRTPLYTHEQWRSPSGQTGVGVAYVHMPLPLSASAVAWFAKQEYGKRGDDGRILAEWTDSLGRAWFEVQNRKYHVRGYVISRGFEAWIIYTGYRVATTPDPTELSLALRSMETIVPASSAPPTTRPAADKRISHR